jgi:hypothetical protein
VAELLGDGVDIAHLHVFDVDLLDGPHFGFEEHGPPVGQAQAHEVFHDLGLGVDRDRLPVGVGREVDAMRSDWSSRRHGLTLGQPTW